MPSRGPARVRRAAVAAVGSLVVLLAWALFAAGSARAAGIPYAATPPTKGSVERDGPNNRYLLDGAWLFRADPGDQGVTQGWQRDLAATDGWSAVSVPNSYNAGDLTPASMTGSVGWYRRDFALPAGGLSRSAPAGARRWIVTFESVNYRATVWLNGHRLGEHAGAYLPFEYQLKGLRPGINRLVVRVDDRRTAGDLPPGPGGGWWNFGGILRDVYLRAVSVADLPQVEVRPLLPCPTCAASIQMQVVVHNLTATTQALRLTGSFGATKLKFAAATVRGSGSWTASATASIPRPHLWSIDDPYLYRATLRLTDAHGRPLGGYTTYSGVRSVTVTRDGRLQLNGRTLDLRGVNLHEQNVDDGAALTALQTTEMMAWVRELGATVIRAHYPLSPLMQELADRDGVLIWSEVPVYQLSSQALARKPTLNQAYSILRQNILDNENHPSVLLWSIGNELPTPVSASEAAYISAAAALTRKLDPTRPVGMAVSDWPGVACQSAYAPLDVLGFNDYFGWFDAGGGSTDDRDALSPFLDSFRACYPDKSIFVTEFGVEGSRNGPIEERGTYQSQSDATAFHLNVFAEKPWLSGAIYFVLQNFAARPGWGGGDPWPDPPFVQKGLVDLSGNRKPVFGVVQAIYRATNQIAPVAEHPRMRPRR